MKVWSQVLILLMLAGLTYAIGIDSWVDKDEFLQIPKAAMAPSIDGLMDDIWFSCPVIKMDTYTSQDPVAPEGQDPSDYLDLTVEARMMWDADNLYFFGRVVDDQLLADGANAYENDSFELDFDLMNKADGATVTQYRWVYNEAAGNPGVTGEQLGWAELDFASHPEYDGSNELAIYPNGPFGTTFELAIPLANISTGLTAAAGTEFGLELQYNDRDNGARETMARWWGTDNAAWNTASLLGNAVLSPVEVDEILPAYSTPSPFSIDAELDDEWLAYPQYSQNVYCTDAVSGWDFEMLDSYWEDCYFTFRVAYDADNCYLYLRQYDDVNDVSNGTSYENDSFEVYWDGDNSKQESGFDDNDKQFRWVSDGGLDNFTNTEAVASVLPDGFIVEAAVPWTELNFEPLDGDVFGFEVQTNDNDTGARTDGGRWWSWNNGSWNSPALFGTAFFAGAIPSAVKTPGVAQAESFGLAQNYPNPFNPTTTIKYAVRAPEHVRLTVYDLMGHAVATLVDETKNVGSYEVTFDASNLASGNYFYKIETGDKVVTKKMTLVK